MIQLLVWVTPRRNSIKYKGKVYELNSHYSKLRRKIENIRILTSGILLTVTYIVPLGIRWGCLAVAIVLLGYVFSLIAYMLRFPNNINEIICDEIR